MHECPKSLSIWCSGIPSGMACFVQRSGDTLGNVQFDATHVLDVLTRLQAVQPHVFGADTHCFQLNPPLREGEVERFEQEHRVNLPSDYRQFITRLGNGGAGPFYGIFPVGKMDDTFGLCAWREDDGLVGVLSKPFPLDADWNDLAGMPPDDLADRNESDYEAQMDAFEKSYWRSSLMNGAIPICHEGCALRVWLVLAGTEAGRVWEDRRSEYAGIRRIALPDGSPATFAAWYDEWLNSCLAKCDTI
jgi:hypothetical protein